MKPLSLTIGIASLISMSTLGSAAAVAGTLILPTVFVPQTATDFDDVVTIPLFDPSLGTLDSIEFTLSGTVLGDVGFENRSARAATITTFIQSTIELQRPDSSLLAQVLPVVSTSTTVARFDGRRDNSGTSGRTFTGLTNSDSTTIVSSDASDLSLFTGPGFINLLISAIGESDAIGTGNLDTVFNNTAGADVTVVYNFTDAPPPVAVPESSAILGMSVAVAAVGSFASKRRVKQA